MPAGIMSSARINIIREFIRIIRNPFIPNPDDPVFDMTGWQIERISPVQTSRLEVWSEFGQTGYPFIHSKNDRIRIDLFVSPVWPDGSSDIRSIRSN